MMADENFDSLQARALHELVKVCWGDFVYESEFDVNFFEEKKNIVAHRKSVIKRISKTFAYTLPKVLKDQFVDAVIRLQRGYHEALVCTERLRKLYTPLILLESGPYSAKNFINPAGHFNELAWAKSFVSDTNRWTLSRFELACVYCFEEVLRDLWYSTINKEKHPYGGEFRIIREKSSYFVAVWVCWLENKFDQVVQEETEYADGFYMGGFRKAMKGYNEYASRFFWARCSNTEKLSLMNEINEYVECLDFSLFASVGYAGYVNFIYSLLSLEEKRHLVSCKIADSNIWSCLLLSRFYQTMLNDIKTIPFPSNYYYGEILYDLIHTMLYLPIPDYIEIFKILWKPISQKLRQETLNIDHILGLAKLNEIGLWDTVFRPFYIWCISRRSVNEKLVLLYDYAGMSSLDEFSKVGDYESMLRYLLLFLVDCHPTTYRFSVRKDATDLLDTFTSGQSRAITRLKFESLIVQLNQLRLKSNHITPKEQIRKSKN